MKKLYTTILLLAFMGLRSWAITPNPNVWVFLCFGQSNMEGNAAIEAVDKKNIPARFKWMPAVNYGSTYTKGGVYKAAPPLCRPGTGLTPVDYFGREMCANLPDSISIIVINVAVGGAPIELFDESISQKEGYFTGQADWYVNYCKQYDMNPYRRLIEMAQKAQKRGVIKGILLHQGESNNCQSDWPKKVKKVYNNMLTELGLEAKKVPLLVGEMVQQNMGGVCWGHNNVIKNIRSTIPTAKIISSKDCPARDDGLHFTAEGYRMIGKRYAEAIYPSLMKELEQAQATPLMPVVEDEPIYNSEWYNLQGQTVGKPAKGMYIHNGKKVLVK